MRPLLIIFFVLALGLGMAQQHAGVPNPPDQNEPALLPNGKSQQDEILKMDHEKNVNDARELARLAAELRDEVEKGDAFVLSVSQMRKAEEIEKIAKRIRGRIKRC